MIIKIVKQKGFKMDKEIKKIFDDIYLNNEFMYHFSYNQKMITITNIIDYISYFNKNSETILTMTLKTFKEPEKDYLKEKLIEPFIKFLIEKEGFDIEKENSKKWLNLLNLNVMDYIQNKENFWRELSYTYYTTETLISLKNLGFKIKEDENIILFLHTVKDTEKFECFLNLTENRNEAEIKIINYVNDLKQKDSLNYNQNLEIFCNYLEQKRISEQFSEETKKKIQHRL